MNCMRKYLHEIYIMRIINIKDRDRYCFILQQVLQESVFRSSDQVIQGYSAGEIQREANDNRISEIHGSTELLSVSLFFLLYIATMTVETVFHVSSARKGEVHERQKRTRQQQS